MAKVKVNGRHAATCPGCGLECWIVKGQIKWYKPMKGKTKPAPRNEPEREEVNEEDEEEEDEDEGELFP